MADTVGMAHNRDSGVLHDILNELIGSPGNQQIDGFIAMKQFVDRLPALHQGHKASGQACLDSGFVNNVKKSPIGFSGFPAPLQDGTVAAFDAQGRNLYQCIRPGFKNDADDTDGAGFPLENQSLIQFPMKLDPEQRIRKADQAFQSLNHIIQFVVIKDQSVDDGLGFLIPNGTVQILLIGGKNLFPLVREAVPDIRQCLISKGEGQAGHLITVQFYLAGKFLIVHRSNPPFLWAASGSFRLAQDPVRQFV